MIVPTLSDRSRKKSNLIRLMYIGSDTPNIVEKIPMREQVKISLYLYHEAYQEPEILQLLQTMIRNDNGVEEFDNIDDVFDNFFGDDEEYEDE